MRVTDDEIFKKWKSLDIQMLESYTSNPKVVIPKPKSNKLHYILQSSTAKLLVAISLPIPKNRVENTQ